MLFPLLDRNHLNYCVGVVGHEANRKLASVLLIHRKQKSCLESENFSTPHRLCAQVDNYRFACHYWAFVPQ